MLDSNERQGTEILKLMNAGALIRGNTVDKNLYISAVYIPGVLHKVADHISYIIIMMIMFQFGRPLVDLFASRLNAQFERFVSWAQDLNAEVVDAFSLN